MTQPVASDCGAIGTTGLCGPVLTEIAGLLDRFIKKGEGGAIDLRSIPMSNEDRAQLEEFLGRGEVSAKLDVAGTSEVWETRFAGVWWVRHADGSGRIAVEVIEVTTIPEILKSDAADIGAAAERLTHALDENPLRTEMKTDQPTEEINA